MKAFLPLCLSSNIVLKFITFLGEKEEINLEYCVFIAYNNGLKKTNFGLTFTGRWLYFMCKIYSRLLRLTLVYNCFSLWISM